MRSCVSPSKRCSESSVTCVTAKFPIDYTDETAQEEEDVANRTSTAAVAPLTSDGSQDVKSDAEASVSHLLGLKHQVMD
jgi:hypothetical protein